MQNVWVFVGIGVVFAVLVLLIGVAHSRAKHRKIRNCLGLPRNSRLSPRHALAFRAFEDTNIRLKTSFPRMPDEQRQSMARDVLRNTGLLPKRNRVEPVRRLRISEIEDQLSSKGIGGYIYTYGWSRVAARNESAEIWMAEGRNNASAPPARPAIDERAITVASRPWPMVHPI